MKKKGYILAESILYICITCVLIALTGTFISMMYSRCCNQQDLINRQMALYSAFDRLLQDVAQSVLIEQCIQGKKYILTCLHDNSEFIWKVNGEGALVRTIKKQGEQKQSMVMAHAMEHMHIAHVGNYALCVLKSKNLKPVKTMVHV